MVVFENAQPFQEGVMDMAAEETPRSPHIDINYIKSHDYRETACDGALGGLTPKGKLWVAFYTERFPLPRVVRHTLRPAEQEGTFVLDATDTGVPLESREGLVRNVECGVYLNLESAQNLYDWLGVRIQEMKKQDK